MGSISRWMPRQPEAHWSRAGAAILAALALGVLAAMYAWPAARWIVGGIAAFVIWSEVRETRRLRRLARERAGEDIGSFVRALDRRAVDPWVVRAVWEALQPYVRFRHGHAPPRPSDDLEQDLHIDSGDLDDMLEDIAERTNHSLEGLDRNPLYGRVKTVGDLIAFVSQQPKRPAV